MKAGCAAQKLQFEAHGKREVVADFDGGRMTSDGGGLLARSELLLGRPDGAAGPVCLRLPPAGVGGAHGDGSDRPARVRARARVRGPQRSRHAAARQGANPRFVVTNLELSGIQSPQRLYEQVYCARGEMENRIKEQQLCLFADRTSSACTCQPLPTC